jgi:hypothetical protein
LSKKSNAGGITIPKFIEVKTAQYWHKNRHKDQWNTIDNPYKKTYDGEKTVSSRNVAGKWLSVCRKLKLDPCLSTCTSINSKWTKNLNIRPKTLQVVHK